MECRDNGLFPFWEGRVMQFVFQATLGRHRFETLLEEQWLSC